MTGDPHREEQERLIGEANIPLLQPARSKDEEQREAEQAADKAYKTRQLEIEEAQAKVSKSNRDLTLVLAILTLLGVVAGGIQGYFAHKGVDVANRSAKTAENAAYQACLGAQISRGALLETQRSEADAHSSSVAAVYQAMAATEGERAEIQLVVKNPRVIPGKEVAINFGMINGGKTAAVHVRLEMRLVFVSRHAEPTFSYPKKQTAGGYSERAEPGPQTFTADASSLAALRPDGSDLIPSGEDRDDWLSGKQDLIFFGRVTYGDVFGGRHSRRFCQPFQNFTPGLIANVGHDSCAKYNGGDYGVSFRKQRTDSTPSPLVPEITCKKPE